MSGVRLRCAMGVGVVVIGAVLGVLATWLSQVPAAEEMSSEGVVLDLTHEGIECPAIGEP